MDRLPEEFANDTHFPLERFRQLYLDSLLLRRSDVHAYCRKHEIRQVRELQGLMFEDVPSQSPHLLPERVPVEHDLQMQLAEPVATAPASPLAAEPVTPSASPQTEAAATNTAMNDAENAESQALAWKTEASKRQTTERKACLLAAVKWKGLDHIEAHKTIHPEQVTDNSRKTYLTKARPVAKKIADEVNKAAGEVILVMPTWRAK